MVYHPNESILDEMLISLWDALHALSSDLKIAIDLVDNTPSAQTRPLACWQKFWEENQSAFSLRTIQGQGNIGYGAGHNLSIKNFDTDYHLVLNPDVILNHDAIAKALHFMDNNPDVILLSPESRDPSNGNLQFQCKQMPGVFVLALRFINSSMLNRLFAHQLATYEEQDKIIAGKQFDAHIVSGCFMLFRTDALKVLEGFDERYFLYFEDFDLSLRANKIGRVVYFPEVKIQHFGGGAGQKGLKHIKFFLRSAWLFFRRWGWKLY